jgi:alpha-galactosidase/6-phospho-beta-glucosidase family protein
MNRPIKIAMIGAGSIGFTRRLMRDILAVPELAHTTFAMTDFSARNLDMVAQLIPALSRRSTAGEGEMRLTPDTF